MLSDLGMKLSLFRAKRQQRPAFVATLAGWEVSTHAELAWRSERSAVPRWSLWGLVIGALVGLIVFAPAAWLARAVASATNGQVLLADARGTIWSGSAVPVLTGGADSRDASALPGRLEWTLRMKGLGLELRAQQACCLKGTTVVRLQPGFGRMTITLNTAAGSDGQTLGQWPAGWLAGLGTPWNTLQLGGALKVTAPALTLESIQGRWRLNGRIDLDLVNVSSRLSTLPVLGSYRLSIIGDGSGPSRLTLSTLDGAMQLSGNGTLGPSGLRLRGEASAAPADEAALSNLLNIIGRRQGARSIIAIG